MRPRLGIPAKYFVGTALGSASARLRATAREAAFIISVVEWNGLDWEGATACAVVRVTCWGFYGGNNSFDSSHQIKPNISIA
jgi:hypothetical protein